MSALEAVGTFAALGVRGRVTGDLQDLLALHVIDTVAAWVAAAPTAEARQLRKFRAVAHLAAPDPAQNILINCASVRLSEVDDIHIGAMITPGSIVVPAALSIAASLPAVDIIALREAIVAGYDAMVRFGLAVDGPKILYRGIWPSYFAAGFGVAAVAARLLNLTEQQAAHALALALTMTPPGVGMPHGATTARWLGAGASARNGLLAARAAQAGFTSDLGLLDGKYLTGIFDVTPDVAALTKNLGEHFLLRDVSFKPWCAARQTMAPTQAFREIVAQGVDVASITAVEVSSPPSFVRMIDHGIGDGDRMNRMTSVQYQLAIAVLDPAAAYDISHSGTVAPAVSALMSKIKVVADESLTAGFPAVWPASVRVRAGDAVKERKLAKVPGDPGRPFGESDIRAKFHAMADRAIGADKVDHLIAATRRMLDGGATPAQLLSETEQACAG
jgi:2-methylcitrate dehydratase PrpD